MREYGFYITIIGFIIAAHGLSIITIFGYSEEATILFSGGLLLSITVMFVDRMNNCKE